MTGVWIVIAWLILMTIVNIGAIASHARLLKQLADISHRQAEAIVMLFEYQQRALEREKRVQEDERDRLMAKLGFVKPQAKA